MVANSNNIHVRSAATPTDPLLLAIHAYRDGLAAYNSAGDDFPDEEEADLYAATIERPNAVLSNWRGAAVSHEAALLAMSLAEDEMALFGDSPVANAMKAAAYGYWNPTLSSPAKLATHDSIPRLSLETLAADVFLTPEEAAGYLRISLPTLARWRSQKCGPIYTKMEARIFYQVSSLRDYLAKNKRRGTRPDS